MITVAGTSHNGGSATVDLCNCYTIFHPRGSAGCMPTWRTMITPAHRAILRLLADGHTSIAAARQLRISHSTCRYGLNVIYLRLRVHNTTSAVAMALRTGLIE